MKMPHNQPYLGTGSSSGFSNGDGQSLSMIGTHSMSMHNDFISFLAVAQYYEVDFISITWEPGLGQIGRGGTSDIRQSMLDPETSLAFKCSTQFGTYSEVKLYNALVSEISILGHPLIRHHQNIASLEGICWEAPPTSEKVWPVLILEKAQHGDLQSFLYSEQGKQIGFEERLGLCTDIGSALVTMHQCHMIHGDIKPGNVLVFSDNSRSIFAKVADFGYSGWDVSESGEHLINLPESRPWQAPEYHHRGFTIAQARKTDLYSFGMLCMYILFEDKLLASPMTLNDKDASMTAAVHTELFRNPDLTDQFKKEGKLLQLAHKFTEAEMTLSVVQKHRLLRFFDCALAYDPEKRVLNVEELTSLLGENWIPGPVTKDLDQMDIGESKLNFQIAKSFYHLMTGHSRVPKYIVACLQTQAVSHTTESRRSNAAFQLAFAYKIGFGVPSDEEASLHWLQSAGRSIDDLSREIQLAKRKTNPNSWRNGVLHVLGLKGIMPPRVTSDGDMKERESELRRHIEVMQPIFGRGNPCVRRQKNSLANLLTIHNRLKEAESLWIEILEDVQFQARKIIPEDMKVPRRRHLAHNRPELRPPILGVELAELERILALTKDFEAESYKVIGRLADNLLEQGRLKEAEWLYIQVILRVESLEGEAHPDTLFAYSDLAYTYEMQCRWTDAEALISMVWKTQKQVLGIGHSSSRKSMQCFARILSAQDRSKESEALKKQLVDVCKNVLGDTDPESFEATEMLLVELANLGRWNEAEEGVQESLKLRNKVYGENHSDTLWFKRNLAAIYQHQGRLEEAQALLVQLAKAQENLLGVDHVRTIATKFDLALVYMHRSLHNEAEDLLTIIIEAQGRCFSQNDPLTLDSMRELAFVYLRRNQFSEAEDLFLRVIDIQEREFGSEYPSGLASKRSLASIYCGQKRFIEAEAIIRPVTESAKGKPSRNTDEQLEALKILVRSLTGQKRWEETENVYEQIIEYLTTAHGPYHWQTLNYMRLQAEVITVQGRCQEADEIFLHIQEKAKLLREERWLQGNIIGGRVFNFWRNGKRVNAVLHTFSFMRWSWGNQDFDLNIVSECLLRNEEGWKITKHVLLPTIFVLSASCMWGVRRLLSKSSLL